MTKDQAKQRMELMVVALRAFRDAYYTGDDAGMRESARAADVVVSLCVAEEFDVLDTLIIFGLMALMSNRNMGRAVKYLMELPPLQGHTYASPAAVTILVVESGVLKAKLPTHIRGEREAREAERAASMVATAMAAGNEEE